MLFGLRGTADNAQVGQEFHFGKPRRKRPDYGGSSWHSDASFARNAIRGQNGNGTDRLTPWNETFFAWGCFRESSPKKQNAPDRKTGADASWERLTAFPVG